MKHKRITILMLIILLGLYAYVGHTLVSQHREIKSLEGYLQHERLKYKILINDPLVKNVMDVGG